MKIKTSELDKAALDYAVAVALKIDFRLALRKVWVDADIFEPSFTWSEGGPIIEREKIATSFNEYRERPDGQPWQAIFDGGSEKANTICYGSAALVAAMRAYVTAKLGDEVEIPEELLNT
jgi:hypothetical protein